MEIIEQIGAYAGLAAVLGLAVLSALYFSQARDVKRLREWAGRAPERVAEGAAADQLARGVVAQPQPKVVQDAQGPAPAVPGAKPATPGAKPATPAAKPVPAAAAAAGAGPATAQSSEDTQEAERVGAAAATPAGAAAAAGQAGAGAPSGQAGAGAPSGQAKPGAPTGQAAGAPPKPADGAPAKPGDGAPAKPGEGAPAKPADGAPPSTPAAKPPQGALGPQTPVPRPQAPAPPAKPGARPGGRPTIPLPSQSRGRAPTPSQTAILPPREGTPPWYRRLLASPRYLVLAIAGVLIVGGAAAFGVTQLADDGGGDGGGSPSEQAPTGGGGGGDGGQEAEQRQLPAVDPATVTVSVLNGTTIPGLAASIADRVAANGFEVGNIDNSADQGARNESVVLFTEGAEREAIAVSRRLGISQREPIDPESQAIAGDASVVVITGTDLTQ